MSDEIYANSVYRGQDDHVSLARVAAQLAAAAPDDLELHEVGSGRALPPLSAAGGSSGGSMLVASLSVFLAAAAQSIRPVLPSASLRILRCRRCGHACTSCLGCRRSGSPPSPSPALDPPLNLLLSVRVGADSNALVPLPYRIFVRRASGWAACTRATLT